MHSYTQIIIYALIRMIWCSRYEERCAVKYDLSMCYSTESSRVRNTKCADADVCQKTYNMTYIRMEPYNSLLVNLLLHTCCGECTKIVEVNTLQDISQVTPSSINISHFVFPVLGRSNMVRLHGYYFIPFIELLFSTISRQRMTMRSFICRLLVLTCGQLLWFLYAG